MQGAPILIEELKKGIINGICIVGEPTNMKIIDAHKVVMNIQHILKVWLVIVLSRTRV